MTSALALPMTQEERFLQLERAGFHTDLQAEATLLDGLTVDQNFNPLIQRYLYSDTRLWPLLRKVNARADRVRDITEGTRPAAGFFTKTAMDMTENPPTAAQNDLSDPGQEIKALGGVINVNHYARSLAAQQGYPYGDEMAEKTDKLVQETAITLERTLFNGDEGVDPNQFNGIAVQMRAANSFTADQTAGDAATPNIRTVVRRSMSATENGQKTRIRPSHIFTSNLGVEILEEEAENNLQYQNLSSITPGVMVPSIRTQAGVIPVVDSIWIEDRPIDATTAEVDFWLLDLERIIWHGVVPIGGVRQGQRRFDPQIFNLSDRVDPTLVTRRVVVQYGALKVDALGLGAWKFTLTVDRSRI